MVILARDMIEGKSYRTHPMNSKWKYHSRCSQGLFWFYDHRNGRLPSKDINYDTPMYYFFFDNFKFGK